MDSYNGPENQFQETEISQIKWVRLEDADEYIRPYNVEKKKVIEKLLAIKRDYSILL